MTIANGCFKRVFMKVIIMTLFSFVLMEDDYDFGQKMNLNELPGKFQKQIEHYLKSNGYYEKGTVDKETFVNIFLAMMTDSSTPPHQKKNFRILGSELAERQGNVISTKDIPSILNFAEVTQLYSELMEEGTVDVNPPQQDNAEATEL